MRDVVKALRNVITYDHGYKLSLRQDAFLRKDLADQMTIIDFIVKNDYVTAKERYFELDTEPRERIAYALEDYAPGIYTKMFKGHL